MSSCGQTPARPEMLRERGAGDLDDLMWRHSASRRTGIGLVGELHA